MLPHIRYVIRRDTLAKPNIGLNANVVVKSSRRVLGDLMALSRGTVEAIFEKHGIPGWVGWGTYGAESSYGTAVNDGGHGFGLIEASYGAAGRPTNNDIHNAEVSAKLYQHLIKEHGGLDQAVEAYSGREYSVTHIQELGKAGKKATGAFAEAGNEKDQGANGGILSTIPGAETAANAIKNTVSPLTAITGFIAKLFDPKTWLRIGKGIVGFMLLAFGALTLMKVLLGVDIPTGAVSSAKLAAGFMA